MRPIRTCFKTTCTRPAVATLTFDYDSATAVLGPLATEATPQAYDLCADHANRLTVPNGWEVIRLETKFEERDPTDDDLMALANEVRKASAPKPPREDQSARGAVSEVDAALSRHPASRGQVGRKRGYLRVISGQETSSPGTDTE